MSLKNKKREYTPKFKQDSKAFSFHITERDIEILKAVNRCRYLKVEQVKRLVFPENKSKQSCQKRLKYLYHGKFLGRIVPFVQPGHGGESTAYFLDKNGAELLIENGEEIYSYTKSGKVKHIFLQHALDLSEFRINLELSLKDNAFKNLYLRQFIADFEVKSNAEKLTGMSKYKLWSQLSHPVNHQKYVVYPDSKIVLKVKEKDIQRLFFLEIDRGTESLNVIRDKVIGYNLYRNAKVFQKFGKFDGFRVLFQTSSEKRAKNMRKALTDLEGEDLVWITDVSKVNEGSVLKEPIWINEKWEYKQILKV